MQIWVCFLATINAGLLTTQFSPLPKVSQMAGQPPVRGRDFASESITIHIALLWVQVGWNQHREFVCQVWCTVRGARGRQLLTRESSLCGLRSQSVTWQPERLQTGREHDSGLITFPLLAEFQQKFILGPWAMTQIPRLSEHCEESQWTAFRCPVTFPSVLFQGCTKEA